MNTTFNWATVKNLNFQPTTQLKYLIVCHLSFVSSSSGSSSTWINIYQTSRWWKLRELQPSKTLKQYLHTAQWCQNVMLKQVYLNNWTCSWCTELHNDFSWDTDSCASLWSPSRCPPVRCCCTRTPSPRADTRTRWGYCRYSVDNCGYSVDTL